MVDMGDNLIDLAYNLDLMREQIADIKPELSRIVDNLVFIQATVSGTQERLPALIRDTRTAFTGLMVLLILTPLPAVYTGYTMVAGASGNNQDEREEA
jgi:hypothetical protein